MKPTNTVDNDCNVGDMIRTLSFIRIGVYEGLLVISMYTHDRIMENIN